MANSNQSTKTNHVVRLAMQAASKDVRAPKVVRENLVVKSTSTIKK